MAKIEINVYFLPKYACLKEFCLFYQVIYDLKKVGKSIVFKILTILDKIVHHQ